MSGEYQWPRSSYSAVGEDEGLLVGALAGLDHDGGGVGSRCTCMAFLTGLCVRYHHFNIVY